MVDHDQNGVYPVYLREICNEVNRELFKGKGGHGGDGVQWQADRVGVHFVLLAHSTSFNEFVNIGS